MQILLIADAVLPVPPETYGGAERVVHLFGREFTRLGHTVHLMAAAGSQSLGGRLHCHRPAGTSLISRARRKAQFQLQSLWASRDCDVVCAHGRVDYLRTVIGAGKPTLIKFPNPVISDEIEALEAMVGDDRIGRPQRPLALQLISRNQRKGIQTRLPVHVIGNPVDTSFFDYGEGKDGYLIILGRISERKGVDTAIEVARRCGLPLVIAGNIGSHPEDQIYFESRVRPAIDGVTVRWTGPVNDFQKRELLQGARALLFPIRWEEPFGTVMVEALACGTPVVAMARGAAPEVLKDGVTGILCDSEEAMVAAVHGIGKLNRQDCRDQATEQHDVQVIAPQVLRVLEQLATA